MHKIRRGSLKSPEGFPHIRAGRERDTKKQDEVEKSKELKPSPWDQS